MARVQSTLGVFNDLNLGPLRYAHSNANWVGDSGSPAGTGTSNSVAYQVGNIVVSNDQSWIALVDNDNIEPGSADDIDIWQSLELGITDQSGTTVENRVFRELTFGDNLNVTPDANDPNAATVTVNLSGASADFSLPVLLTSLDPQIVQSTINPFLFDASFTPNAPTTDPILASGGIAATLGDFENSSTLASNFPNGTVFRSFTATAEIFNLPSRNADGTSPVIVEVIDPVGTAPDFNGATVNVSSADVTTDITSLFSDVNGVVFTPSDLIIRVQNYLPDEINTLTFRITFEAVRTFNGELVELVKNFLFGYEPPVFGLYEEVEFFSSADANLAFLSDRGNIEQGIRTGRNSGLILDENGITQPAVGFGAFEGSFTREYGIDVDTTRVVANSTPTTANPNGVPITAPFINNEGDLFATEDLFFLIDSRVTDVNFSSGLINLDFIQMMNPDGTPFVFEEAWYVYQVTEYSGTGNLVIALTGTNVIPPAP